MYFGTLKVFRAANFTEESNSNNLFFVQVQGFKLIFYLNST